MSTPSLPRYTPSWSSGAYVTRVLPPRPDMPTLFEERVRALGLEKRPDLWADSQKLKAFVRANRHKHYVPEWLIKEFGWSLGEGEA